MTAILVPIFVCVVLPVAIVAIVFAAAMNNDNKRAKVLIKAIESNCGIDADKLAEALQKLIFPAIRFQILRSSTPGFSNSATTPLSITNEVNDSLSELRMQKKSPRMIVPIHLLHIKTSTRL